MAFKVGALPGRLMERYGVDAISRLIAVPCGDLPYQSVSKEAHTRASGSVAPSSESRVI